MAELSLPVGLLAQRCREDHIPDISLKFNWRLAAPHLNLSAQQIDDIHAECYWEQVKRVRTLNTWREKYGHRATFGVLIRALQKAELNDQAAHVAAVLLRAHKPRSRLSSTATNSSGSADYHTPPQSPPRPPRRTSRHTQTEVWTPPPTSPQALPITIDLPTSATLTSGTERRSVPNKYTPVIIPTPRRDEQSTRAYLSTSFSPYPSSSTPSQIAATQTEAFQLPTTAFPVRHQSSPPAAVIQTSRPPLPPPRPQSRPHGHQLRHHYVERSRSSRSDYRCVCYAILVPVCIALLIIAVLVICMTLLYLRKN